MFQDSLYAKDLLVLETVGDVCVCETSGEVVWCRAMGRRERFDVRLNASR